MNNEKQMQINKTKNGFYLIISLSVIMLLLLGSWWLYLVFKLAHQLEVLNSPVLAGNLVSMVKWEGATFLILLLTLTVTLVYIYILDHKKNKSLQAFFSSLTHELKTPLASIKLQTQVLTDIIEQESLPEASKLKINKYSERLVNDSLRLEDQLDNHLQLSRLERNAPLNLRPVNLKQFLQKEQLRYEPQVKFKLDFVHPNIFVLADDFALQTVIRNLIENTLKHAHVEDIQVTINVEESSDKVLIRYQDNGVGFTGDHANLVHLFYKHNSPQGSGIGLYLVNEMLKRMKGRLEIISGPTLAFVLELNNKGSDE